MQLSDQRLSFASDLILHWSDIRDGLLVPSELDLDFHELQRVLPMLSMMDTPTPDASTVVVMGQGRVAPELWPEVKDANWYDLIPPEGKDVAVRSRKSLIETPCGVYYHYTASGADNFSRKRRPWSCRCVPTAAKRRRRQSLSPIC